MSTYGQTAYEAYFRQCGGVSLISGAPLPTWENQAKRIQEAWQAAAQAVGARLIHHLVEEGIDILKEEA
jgi:hypothetical protein